MKRIVSALLLTFGLALAAASPVFAQEWPARPIKVIIPYPPGGQTDIVARWLGEKLSPIFGQPFVMENRPGAQAIVGISAGGSERFDRRLPDGRIEQVTRERRADVDDLLDALMAVTAGGAATLEAGRQAAVLAHVDQRSQHLARDLAEREAEATVVRYTRRAVIGAMAAVAPGSDIIIQGALGTAMVRELARIHDVPVRELDVEHLLARLGLTLRNATAIVLAIAGNALKAFPGLGTLGGGVLHAIAYGLAFDSLGRAIAQTLAAHARLDQAEAESAMRKLLTEPSRERVERVTRVVIDSLRNRNAPAAGDD